MRVNEYWIRIEMNIDYRQLSFAYQQLQLPFSKQPSNIQTKMIQHQDPIQMSSQSDAEDLDLDQLGDIQVDEKDLQAFDNLLATTKQQIHTIQPHQPSKQTAQVDLFLRNFFIRHKMTGSLNNFQQQWNQLLQKGQKVEGRTVPQQYVRSEQIKDQIKRVKQDLDKAVIVAEKARRTYDKLLKERNFYKMHHQRVQQQKKKLNFDLQKLRNNHIVFQKKYDQMADKFSHLMKEKMMIKLQRDRLKTRAQIQREMNTTNNVVTNNQQNDKLEETQTNQQKSQTIKPKQKIRFTPFPPDDRHNPFTEQQTSSFDYKSTVLYKTFRPHNMAVTALALHPKKPIIATVSDDLSWKIMTVPQGELIMSGEGHKDWVSGIKFHPKGLQLITCSGDSTIKMWDFVNTSCTHTFKDHTQPVWDVDFHDTGDFFASASMDHLAKIFDVNVGKCRSSLRGHVDSVNAVCFQPFSNIVSTASADKTVSLWDLKTSLCVQTFYGHNNAVNDVCFNLAGDKLASCDSDGIIKVWDVRMVKEKSHYDSGQFSVNSIDFDPSGTMLAIATANKEIKIYNESMDKLQTTLKGHQDAVLDVVFDTKQKAIYSCGADCTFRVWQ